MPHIHDLYDFTASAFILHPTEPKIALLMHKKLFKWLQPGGHVELDEDPLQALEHELAEETGLRLANCEIIQPADQPTARIGDKHHKTLPLPFHFNVHDFYDDGSHRHIDLEFLVRANTEKLSPAEGESQDIAWFTVDEIRELNKKGECYDATLDICKWIAEKYF